MQKQYSSFCSKREIFSYTPVFSVVLDHATLATEDEVRCPILIVATISEPGTCSLYRTSSKIGNRKLHYYIATY